MPRSQKSWVRKHQPSYWSVWFGKNKKKDEGSGTDVSPHEAQQGSVQFNPQDQFAGHNSPPQDLTQDQYQHQPPPDDYQPPPQQYVPHEIPGYQQPELNSHLGSFRTGDRIPSMRWSPERGLESFRTGEIPYVPEMGRVQRAKTRLGERRDGEDDDEGDE